MFQSPISRYLQASIPFLLRGKDHFVLSRGADNGKPIWWQALSIGVNIRVRAASFYVVSCLSNDDPIVYATSFPIITSREKKILVRKDWLLAFSSHIAPWLEDFCDEENTEKRRELATMIFEEIKDYVRDGMEEFDEDAHA